jgi:hypothetical protein
VQTNPNEGWFVLFRFSGPEREYSDKTWKLPDFEKIIEMKSLNVLPSNQRFG